MKAKIRICDICGDCIECRRHVGYKIKKRLFFVDMTYHKMDICDNCMNKIISGIKDIQAEKSKLQAN